jgi:hypothetical protein
VVAVQEGNITAVGGLSNDLTVEQVVLAVCAAIVVLPKLVAVVGGYTLSGAAYPATVGIVGVSFSFNLAL